MSLLLTIRLGHVLLFLSLKKLEEVVTICGGKTHSQVKAASIRAHSSFNPKTL